MTVIRPIWARRAMASLFERNAGVRRLRAHLGKRVGSYGVVEAGCGFGFNAARCTGEYLGLDPDSAIVAAARREQPRGTFLAANPLDPAVEHRPRHTALLCLVLHELEERRPLLRAMAGRASERVLIYDYDPDLGPLGRLRLSLLEPPALATYWQLDLPGELDTLGFRLVETGVVAPTFRFWEFVRGPTDAPPASANRRTRRPGKG